MRESRGNHSCILLSGQTIQSNTIYKMVLDIFLKNHLYFAFIIFYKYVKLTNIGVPNSQTMPHYQALSLWNSAPEMGEHVHVSPLTQAAGKRPCTEPFPLLPPSFRKAKKVGEFWTNISKTLSFSYSTTTIL